YTSSGWGNFVPNDRLVVDIVGQVGSSQGLSVFINDSTSASRSLNWSYGAAVSATGLPLTPAYDTSGLLDQGWSYGLNVEATWENCPHASGPTTCNTYDGPAVNALDVPKFQSATFWNATTRRYSNTFAWTETTSSTGACSGKVPYVAPCYDYTSFGGTGFYPYWSLHAAGGKAWWNFGGTYPDEVSNFGGIAQQFAPYGLPPDYIDPTSVFENSSATSALSANVSAQIADPNGVARVNVSDYWCNGAGVPTAASAAAVLGTGPENTSQSGNWSAVLPRNGAYHGTMHYWVTAQSTSGVWTSPSYGQATFAGGASCSFSAPVRPWFGAPNITAVSDGYLLQWEENSSAIRNYTVWLNATQNGTPFAVNVGAASSTTVAVPNATADYQISLVATNFADLSSSRTAWVAAPAPVSPLTAALSLPGGSSYWVQHADPTFSSNVSGGVGPFVYQFYFSDGTNISFASTNRSASVAHNFGNYFGTAQVYFLVADAFGAIAESNSVPVTIWATPLGVNQTVSAGDGWVLLNWSAPLSPAGPTSHYTVYYTTNALWAPYLTEYNVSEWNTTRTSLLFPIPDGQTLYAQVTAWNLYGQGQLPSGSPPPVLAARTAPLNVSAIGTRPGGTAPFTDLMSAFVTGGTNLIVSSAIYSFSGSAFIIPSINATANGTWVNGSYTFATPGLKTIVLHVTDSLFDTTIVTASVWVAPGVGPSVTVTSMTALGWVGQSIGFGAVVTAGSGNYSYVWAFGDGEGATGASPSHTYLSSGSYETTVWVTDDETLGVSVQNLTVTVFALPTVAISTSAGPNGSLSYTFTAITSGGSGPPTLVWAFGDGTIGHGSPVSHDFGASGTYTVSLISTDLSNRAAYANITLSTANTNGGGTTTTPLSGSGAALLVIVAALAFVFLLGMLYFWNRGRGLAGDPASGTTGNEIVVRDP
ncbi:MAG: PKD domain-containing protein, partial [Thermoplasmata archaeon]|nr:PKD domain-containing protein [Thermoplasmata archaeon]